MPERRLRRWLAWAMDREQARRAPFLAHSPLFAGLPRRMLGRLATRFLEKAYHAGEVVFHEGDPGRALFVVVEGTVEIIQATPRGEHVVRTLGAGDAFGELALIDESQRSGSARVAEPGRLLILYKSDFDALMDGEARIALVVLRNLSRVLAAYARRNPVVVTEPAPRAKGAPPPP
jgi:CRP/FNR family transcriptional regulator, cyclic AMP receptor protein